MIPTLPTSFDLQSPVNCWRSMPTSLRALWRYNLTGQFLMATWKIVGWFTPYKSGVHSIFGWIIQTMQTYMGNLGGFTFQTALFGLVISLTPCTWWRRDPQNALAIQPRLVVNVCQSVAPTSILQKVKNNAVLGYILNLPALEDDFIIHEILGSQKCWTNQYDSWLMVHVDGCCTLPSRCFFIQRLKSELWTIRCAPSRSFQMESYYSPYQYGWNNPSSAIYKDPNISVDNNPTVGSP